MLIAKHQAGVSKHIGNYGDAAVVGPNARWLYTPAHPGLMHPARRPKALPLKPNWFGRTSSRLSRLEE